MSSVSVLPMTVLWSPCRSDSSLFSDVIYAVVDSEQQRVGCTALIRCHGHLSHLRAAGIIITQHGMRSLSLLKTQRAALCALIPANEATGKDRRDARRSLGKTAQVEWTPPPPTHTRMHARTHARTHAHTHTHTHTHARTHTRTYAHAHTPTLSHTRTHARTHARTRTHTRTHARTHTHTHTHTHASMA